MNVGKQEAPCWTLRTMRAVGCLLCDGREGVGREACERRGEAGMCAVGASREMNRNGNGDSREPDLTRAVQSSFSLDPQACCTGIILSVQAVRPERALPVSALLLKRDAFPVVSAAFPHTQTEPNHPTHLDNHRYVFYQRLRIILPAVGDQDRTFPCEPGLEHPDVHPVAGERARLACSADPAHGLR